MRHTHCRGETEHGATGAGNGRRAGTSEQYIQTIDLSKLINLMVGDLQRIAVYPGMGFQAVELIPAEVDASFRRLIKAGFTNHLIALPNNDVHR
jgi:hypothetical protein